MALLRIHSSQRIAKMRAHTATHLLHYALEQILWQTKQAGSLVDSDYLRFDFAAKEALSNEQLVHIQTMVNHWIKWAYPVTVKEMSLQEAKDLWAKAFFEDKYGEKVRVVSIHQSDWSTPIRSIELCWWTHVNNTAQVWWFIIETQSAVASWIRRISWYTGPGIVQQYQHLEERILHIASLLWCQPAQTPEKIEKILKEQQEQQKTLEHLYHTLISTQLEKILPIDHALITYSISSDIEPFSLVPQKQLLTIIKQQRADKNILIHSAQWWFALYTWATKNAKEYCKNHWIQWGWSDILIQGKDKNVIEKIGL